MLVQAVAQPQPSDCIQALRGGPTAASAEVCQGDEHLKLADAASKGSAEQRQHWEEAVDRYRRAATLTRDADVRARAIERVTQLYDAPRLNEPGEMEAALRELIGLRPEDMTVVQRLAKSLEDRGLIEAAEDTLLAARHRKPQEIEPYRMLARFYARRATALHREAETAKPLPQVASGAGQPDDEGIYTIGGTVTPPHRLGNPRYPEQALAAQISGVVAVEVVLNESGTITDARVVRSIPLLDEAALQAVREWRYEPTIVDGKAVPVRMTLTVNFTVRPAR
jgi:TonB family protein